LPFSGNDSACELVRNIYSLYLWRASFHGHFPGTHRFQRAVVGKGVLIRIRFLGPHAEFFSMKEKKARMEKGTKPNPFIDPAGYREYLTNGERDFQKTLEAQNQKKSAGQ